MKYKWIENLVASSLTDEEVIDQLMDKLEEAIDLLDEVSNTRGKALEDLFEKVDLWLYQDFK